MPSVSIITPVFNGVEFLDECIKSVQAQTVQDWELIIAINGHGTDGGDVYTKAMVHASDPRIRVIVQGPAIKGKVASLNDAMCHTNAEWICVLDCDDTWTPNKLQIQLATQKSVARDAAVIGTGCVYMGTMTGSPRLKTGWITLSDLLECNEVVNSSCMVHRTWCTWREVFGMDDYDMWLRIALVGGKIYTVPDHLVYHRVHAESAFNSKHVSPKSLQACYGSVALVMDAMYKELK